MKWSEKSVREDVIRFLDGEISANALIERNDVAVEDLQRQAEPSLDSWQRAWEFAGAVENALAQFAFEYMDESRLREILSELVADPERSESTSLEEQLRLREDSPAATGLVDYIASHPFQPLTVLVLDIEGHSGNERVPKKNVEPDRAFVASRDPDARS